MSTAHHERSRRAFWAVFTVFLANGALFGTWVSRIPTIQSQLHLSEAGLGLVLVGLSLGVLLALSFSGSLIASRGSRKITVGGMGAACLILPLIGLAPHALFLWGALFLFGGALSAMDVAMNAQAVIVEQDAQRRYMSTFHGAFSVGGLLGALLGAAMASLGLPPILHFSVASIVFGLATALSAKHLLISNKSRNGKHAAKQPVFSVPPRALWPLGSVALVSSIAEGAMADWSGVYLTEVMGTSTATAALGFAAYSLTMTLGRLTGDRLNGVWTSARIVKTGGVISALGLGLVVSAVNPILTLTGFAIIGIGLANIIPIAFRTAGNAPDIPAGTGIAAVATIGYAGFLAGPPFIGFLAEATSLRLALFTIALMLVTLHWSATAVSESGEDRN